MGKAPASIILAKSNCLRQTNVPCGSRETDIEQHGRVKREKREEGRVSPDIEIAQIAQIAQTIYVKHHKNCPITGGFATPGYSWPSASCDISGDRTP
jgi:hypothetical protein